MKEKHTTEIRAFNRFYTDIMGLLDKYLLNSQFTLPEARVLYELSRHDSITASEIISLLHIDKGYLSRIMLQFEKRKLVSRTPSPEDSRSIRLSLTASGKKAFEALNQASDKQAKKILSALTDDDCNRLVQHMQEIKTILIKANLYETD